MRRAQSSFVAVLLAACATNPVRVEAVGLAEVVRTQQLSAYDGDALSGRTLALLDRLGFPPGEHAAAVVRLARPIVALADHERLMARAELLYHLAERGEPAQRADRFLESACDAARALGCRADEAQPVFDPLRNRALERHGYALTRFLGTCLAEEPELAGLLRLLRERHRVDVDWRVDGPWELTDFDRWHCADTMAVAGLRHRYRRLGAGVPLVAERDAERGVTRYLTPEAVTRGFTAVLRPADGERYRGRLELLDPRRTHHVDAVPGLRVPLAADFTAPFAWLLAQAQIHALEDRSFFSSDVAGREGLYLLEDYDPDRVPVVMVHGLWSSPLTWRDLTNDVFGDETLHGRYQVWHYFYATGTPLLENVRQLRETLLQARSDLDPELDDPATQRLVLVGHSMGGLLSRMAVSRTGDAIWNTVFEAPFDRVAPELQAEDRDMASRLYFWEPLPFVDRVIFIAAPHRGSGMADDLIGRLGSTLMSVPRRLRDFVGRIRRFASMQVDLPTSVDELSPSHPVMRALSALPIGDGVVYHSIMGDVSGSADSADWTDGVVPYWSSRLDGAASEAVIPDADHAVHFDPRASAEVRRILRAAR